LGFLFLVILLWGVVGGFGVIVFVLVCCVCLAVVGCFIVVVCVFSFFVFVCFVFVSCVCVLLVWFVRVCSVWGVCVGVLLVGVLGGGVVGGGVEVYDCDACGQSPLCDGREPRHRLALGAGRSRVRWARIAIAAQERRRRTQCAGTIYPAAENSAGRCQRLAVPCDSTLKIRSECRVRPSGSPLSAGSRRCRPTMLYRTVLIPLWRRLSRYFYL